MEKNSLILGFSDELINHPKCSDYIKNGWAGYIHHSERCVETDQYIEKRCKELNIPMEYLAAWLTSTDGRHFCDQFYDLELDQKIKLCEDHLIEIHNLGLVYSDPTHGGMLESTLQIKANRNSELWKKLPE